jgi:MinD-like ATPase involved in chromosome partitioning or flagellar assembly
MYMKLKLLIASTDVEYAQFLAQVLSENHAEKLDVDICSVKVKEQLKGIISAQLYDMAFLDATWAAEIGSWEVRCPFVLVEADSALPNGFTAMKKYQRISKIVENALNVYGQRVGSADSCKNTVTAVYSPAGGVGKTTAALSYASLMVRKLPAGAKVIYLNLETIASTPAFFPSDGKSLSGVLANINSPHLSKLIGNVLVRDEATGLFFFQPPEDFEEMASLNKAGLTAFVSALTDIPGELVIDMPCAYDDLAAWVFSACDKLLLVTDNSDTAGLKVNRLLNHKPFEKNLPKAIFCANKGAGAHQNKIARSVQLPFVKAENSPQVRRALMEGFESAVR